MIDPFLARALVGGVAVAMIAAPLGCFVVWRRMAYFGDTLAHSALLGVALGLLLSIDPVIGVLGTCGFLAVAIVLLQEQRGYATDTLLGILSHSALALGIVAISLSDRIRIDLMGYLFGDILAVSDSDLLWIAAGGAVALIGIAVMWRRLLAVTVSEELARAEGIDPRLVRLGFTLLLAVVIAVSMRLVGILLITSLLIIPAATARRFADTPERMAVFAALTGAAAVAGGLWLSLALDTPSGPSVVVAALILFMTAQIIGLAALLRR